MGRERVHSAGLMRGAYLQPAGTHLESVEDALVLVGVGLDAAFDQVERHDRRVRDATRQDATEAGDGEELGRAILAAVLGFWRDAATYVIEVSGRRVCFGLTEKVMRLARGVAESTAKLRCQTHDTNLSRRHVS